ncbi:HAAS signaling domain-containing protein [Staphylococcus sp. 11261D007BR]
MTKKQYLQTLYLYLKHLPEAERNDIVGEYDRHFIEGIKDGRSEEEIAHMLGDPKALARDISAENAVYHAEVNQSSNNLFKAILSVLGLSILNFILVMGPLIIYIGILIGLLFTTLVMLAAPILLLIKQANPQWGEVVMTDWFAALGYIGVGLMLIVITILIIKWGYIAIVKYLKWNVKVVKGSVRL